MNILLINKIKENEKLYNILKNNSSWYKELNRTPDNFSLFMEEMKDKYHLRVTDKINNAIDNIDLISNILTNFNE